MSFFSDLYNRIYTYVTLTSASGIERARGILGLVEGRPLDDQQIRCIVRPDDSHLVIAGAGTGKTTTIVGKVKYLLKTETCKPEDILVLSFTNASASEMKERIHKEVDCDIEASTFHKLGLNIITQVEGITPKITKIIIQQFVKDKIAMYMKEPGYLGFLCNYFIFNNKHDKSEFDFTSLDEYNDYLRSNPPVSLKGDRVKSYGEADIANFLYMNGVSYEYEKEYCVDTRTEDRAQYYPDFYLPDYDLYIEYYGIDRKGNVPEYFTSRNGMSPSEEYREGMEWKRKIHEENHTGLIECYAYERFEGSLLSALEKKLKDNRVNLSPMNPVELWRRISSEHSKNVLTGLSELIATAISHIKSNDYSIDKVRSLCNGKSRFQGKAPVLDLIEPVYNSYQAELRNNDEIDFNDMINLASKMVRDGRYVNPYKYVIVDEYQDISRSRYRLLKALRDSSFYKLFCVGDDWQSIYRFAGSDIDYIINFSRYWGKTRMSKIETTYRFSESLIDISGSFIMQNPLQIKKAIKGKYPGTEFALEVIKGRNERYAIGYMVQSLDELPNNASVFFIGRYNSDKEVLSDNPDIDCKYDMSTGRYRVIYSKRKDLNMEFITAHRSKGLQADYVYVINNKANGMGFPSKIQDDPIINILLENEETYPFAEERRLFYVALTRSKVKSYLVVAEGDESSFASELENRYSNELKNAGHTCPFCGGRLVKRKGPYSEFWGCSNYGITGCNYILKPEAAAKTWTKAY